MVEESPFQAPPTFTDEQWAACKAEDDYWPLAFELYKYVAILCSNVSNIERRSPACVEVSPRDYAVLTGLLNRCARLMLANTYLGKGHKFGETTAILDRCIGESCIKLSWLCKNSSREALERYLADGLKTELEYKRLVEAKVAARNGAVLPIEERMLDSFDYFVESTGLTEAEVMATKALPNLASMMDNLGWDRLAYVTLQKMGSHHVHGRWPSLRRDYLQEDSNGDLVPRDHDVATHINQLTFVPMLVVRALQSFIARVIVEQDRGAFSPLFEHTLDSLGEIVRAAAGDDFVEPDGGDDPS